MLFVKGRPPPRQWTENMAGSSPPLNNRTMFTFNSGNVAALEDQYQLATYKKMPIVAERGEGVWIYASNGDRYLDLYGGGPAEGSVDHGSAAERGETEHAEHVDLLFHLDFSQVRARAGDNRGVSLAP